MSLYGLWREKIVIGWDRIRLVSWGPEVLIQSLRGLEACTELPCLVLVAGLSPERESCWTVGKVGQGEVLKGMNEEG